MQGGASTQFSAVPLNLVTPEDTIDHIVTGSWSKKAIAEAEKYCVAHLTAKVCHPALLTTSRYHASAPRSPCTRAAEGGATFDERQSASPRRQLAGSTSHTHTLKPCHLALCGCVWP